MKILGKNSRKIHLKLTLKFTPFFILISVLVYWYLATNYEDEVLELFKFKYRAISKYFQQVPQPFTQWNIEEKKNVQELIYRNEAAYVVLEDSRGILVDAVNLKYAEKKLYLIVDNPDDISVNKSIQKVAIPIKFGGMQVGKVYVGFNSLEIARSLQSKYSLAALSGLAILIIGLIFTFYLSSRSSKPISRLLLALDSTKGDSRAILKEFKNDELGLLAQKIDAILKESDESSYKLENLNRKLKETYRGNIKELDLVIKQRKETEKVLRKSEEQFELLFENAPIGMVILSLKGIIINVNHSFCKNVGCDIDGIMGLPVKKLFDWGDFGDQSSDKLMNMLNNLDIECTLVKKDGTTIDAVVKSHTLYDQNDRPSKYIMQVLDISDIKNVQNELIVALEKAKESDRLKSAFLAQMSHEIRTPLNVILTSVPILADDIGDADEDTKAILSSVDSAGKRLHRTIDMILSMSAIQSGNYNPEFESFNIVEEIKNLTEEFKSITDEKGLKMLFSSNVSATEIIADKYTVAQIFQNLIGNAIKYTQRGKIKVLVEDASEQKGVVVKVCDTGIGLSKEYIERMFLPFSQEDVGQKREYEGNGLGLALVKEYVELNKASISVESEKNKGSVFSVTFEKTYSTVSQREGKNIPKN
jgi:PAS domain S-box-containing protein